MTMPEFLNAEAEREGKGRSGGDIFEDIVASMNEDSERCKAEMRKPSNALVAIKQAVEDAREYWNDDGVAVALPEIVEVVKVLDANLNQSFRSSTTAIRAEVMCADGKLRYVHYWVSNYAGTRLEPPDEDSDLSIGEFRPMNNRPWECLKCGTLRDAGGRHWMHIKQSDNPKMAVHVCPYCNGYEREKSKRRAERGRARMARAKAKKFGWAR